MTTIAIRRLGFANGLIKAFVGQGGQILGVVDDLTDNLAPRLGISEQLGFTDDQIAVWRGVKIVHEPGCERQFHADRNCWCKRGLDLLDRQHIRIAADELLKPPLVVTIVSPFLKTNAFKSACSFIGKIPDYQRQSVLRLPHHSPKSQQLPAFLLLLIRPCPACR